MTKANYQTVVLPEYIPDNLGAPFEVVLKNSVRQVVDEFTGEVKKTIIPNPRGLLHKIALTRLVMSRKLSGAEIKFIRKSLSIKATELAEMIGVSPEHLSRCEAGERILSVGPEKCLRMAVLLELLSIPEEIDRACEEDGDLKEKVQLFRDAFSKLCRIVRCMNIESAHDAEDVLSFAFYVVRKDDNLFDSPDDGDWADEPLAEAA